MTASLDIPVFVGPSFPQLHREGLPGLVARPPARRGDIASAAASGAAAIGLVDGVFESCASVWHKEILFALERGVAVFGAASLGALRAAELNVFGMIGVGSIFERYRDGEITRDDAVMVLHAPSELGYAALTVSLVDMHDTLDAARDAISPVVHAELKELAATMHFKERTWETLAEIYLGVTRGSAGNLIRSILPHSRSTKQDDVISLIATLREYRDNPVSPHTVEVPQTSFLKALLQEQRL